MSNNPIESLALQYKEEQLEKYTYIDKMHAFNKTLYYFSKTLKTTDIEKIEIQDNLLLFTTRKDNIRLMFNGVDRRGVPFDILNFGYYEKEDENILFSVLDKDSIIFDVGGNIGWYSLLFAKRLPNSVIYSFEPIDQTYKYLCANVVLNGVQNVIPVNIGLTEKKGEIKYYFFPEGSVLASEKNLINCTKAKEVICRVETLDQFFEKEKIAKLDFIKCDVEGAELFTIKGGISTIKKYLPILFIELFERWAQQFNYHPNDVINLLNGLGYDCFRANDSKLEKCSRYEETKTERLNFFFLHREKHRKLINTLS
jgi:FkbM family methyltransferase